ncbi:HlyU family transcriptional regulator [Palleronia sp.]|uniref:HlyU family transcriptional regulator n=1 Tax=Palleronia sp. TaxID=1940284 RepID=UPI0035C874CD
MSILSKLFGRGGGGASAPEEQPVTYKGFIIRPAPIVEGKQHRLAAWIEKEVNGETRSHHLIRADMTAARDTAVEAAIAKSKQVIDEQGEGLFS